MLRRFFHSQFFAKLFCELLPATIASAIGAYLINSYFRPPAPQPQSNTELVQLLSNFRNHFAEGLPDQTTYPFDVDVRRWDNDARTFVSIFSDWQAFALEDLRAYDHKIDVRFDEFGRVEGSMEIFRKPVELPHRSRRNT